MGYAVDARPEGDVLRVAVSGTMDDPSLAHGEDEAEGIALACISNGSGGPARGIPATICGRCRGGTPIVSSGDTAGSAVGHA